MRQPIRLDRVANGVGPKAGYIGEGVLLGMSPRSEKFSRKILGLRGCGAELPTRCPSLSAAGQGEAIYIFSSVEREDKPRSPFCPAPDGKPALFVIGQ